MAPDFDSAPDLQREVGEREPFGKTLLKRSFSIAGLAVVWGCAYFVLVCDDWFWFGLGLAAIFMVAFLWEFYRAIRADAP